MFEYFLVFEKEESLNLELQPLSDLLNYIRENIEFMQQDDMNITYTLEDEHYQIACNIEMLQRAMEVTVLQPLCMEFAKAINTSYT